MSRTYRRLGQVTATAAAVAALTGCTPPHQVDSDLKVDTAPLTSSVGDVPGYINCVGEPVVKPTAIILDCVKDSFELQSITWDTWGKTQAKGQGALTVADFDGNIVGTQRMFSEVILTDVRQTPQGEVFSTVVINGERYDI